MAPPFLVHLACNHHGSSQRACLSFISRGKDSRRRKGRISPHSFYFFFLSLRYILSSASPSLLLTQSLKLAPITLSKPSVASLSLSLQPTCVQSFGVTYTRLAYRVPPPAGSHH